LSGDPGDAQTEDGFLGKRLSILQPKSGFRAGHDSVLLAAAVPARHGDRILELGSGAGVASLCLASRIKTDLLGIEIDSELVRLGNESARRNALSDHVRFETGEISAERFAAREIGLFDHVFFNPPFHPKTGQASPIEARDRAMRDPGGVIPAWIKAAFSVLKPEGTVTLIMRADPLSEVIALCPGHQAVLFPLFARDGERPSRIILCLKEGVDNIALAAGLVLHRADGSPTPEAEAILRGGQGIDLGITVGVVAAHSH
jgi:tRNA1(Val) A37 N6-methylase TrmN6